MHTEQEVEGIVVHQHPTDTHFSRQALQDVLIVWLKLRNNYAMGAKGMHCSADCTSTGDACKVPVA